jgi:hypothetical protein
MTADEQFAMLMQRPDFEQVKRQYEDLLEQVRAALQSAFKLPDWREREDSGGTTGCASQFPDLDSGEVARHSTAAWSTDGEITPDDWDETKSVLSDLGGELGFDRVTLEIGARDNLAYELSNDAGGKLRIFAGAGKHTVVRVVTGCHPTSEAKERGRPLTEEELDERRRTGR